jgi:hypothetical protein
LYLLQRNNLDAGAKSHNDGAMNYTRVDLYLYGPQPRLDRVRVDPSPVTRSKDAVCFDIETGGVTERWVRGGMKGVSCFSQPNGALRGSGKWWRLPQGTPYDDGLLFLYTNDGDHWCWVPTRDMRLTEFCDCLGLLNVAFTEA